MTLDELAIKYGTDKSSRGHNYCKYYEMFFRPLLPHIPNLLEIGIDKGDSLKMWAHYFIGGDIHGIDIRDGYEYLAEWSNSYGFSKINTHLVDHSNKADLMMFGMQHDQYFDIIIEDGSHMSADSILTFETLFPYIKPGGYYCCEDVLCDYDSRWNKGQSSIAYFKKLIDDVNMGGVIPNDAICANKSEAIKKYNGSYFQNNIEWVFSACGLFIIKKI